MAEVDPTGRAVLVSLDTPVPDASAAATPTPGSIWALVTVPPSDDAAGGAFPGPLARAVADYVRSLLARRAAAPDTAPVEVPVQGLAGTEPGAAGAGVVRFTGTASPTETVALGPPDDPAVVALCVVKVVTAEPAPASPVTTTTAPAAPSTTTPTSTTSEPATTSSTTTSSTSSTTTSTTTTSTTTTSTTTERSTPSTTGPDGAGGEPAGDPVTLPTKVEVGIGGKRDVRLWPFASDSVWNTPLGDEATFDPRPVVPGAVNINSTAYGVSIGGAGYPFVAQNPSSEQHEFQVQADQVTAFGTTKWLNAFGEHVVIDLRGNGLDVTVTGNPGHYERATKMSGYGGPLREWELQAAAMGDVHAIKHAIALAVSSHVLNQSHVWPAFAHDSFADGNTGFMPEGSLMAIPPDATMPAGLNNVARAVWQAMHDYGAYAADATGPNGGPTDTLTVVEAEAAADAIVNTIRGAQITSVAQQLRWVTNMSKENVGGPGNRLAPLAPEVDAP